MGRVISLSFFQFIFWGHGHGQGHEGAYSSAVEVILSTQDDSLVLGNALDLVTPLAGDLDASLDRLGTSVHGHNHVEAEVAGDELGKAREDIIVESAGAQSEAGSLVNQSLDQLGVAVALVDGGVGGEEVQILLSLGIPHGGTLSARKDNGQWVVVVSSIFIFSLNGLGGGGRVVGESAVGGAVGGHGGGGEERWGENGEDAGVE